MKPLLNKLNQLWGAGIHLLVTIFLIECGAGLITQWMSAPIPITSKAKIILTVILSSISLAGIVWFNRTLNLIKVNLLDGKRELVTTGPFNYVRHPLYTVLLLAMLPLTIVWFADWIFVVAWVLSILISHKIVALEERGLHQEFGEHYQTYSQYVPALLPYKGNGGERYREEG